MEGRASAQSRRMVDRTRSVCVCVSHAGAQMALGVCCACLRQCPGRTGVPRCACGHMCVHVHVPVGCSHTAHACVGMQASQWHEKSQLCPQISLSGQRAGWRKGSLKLILYPGRFWESQFSQSVVLPVPASKFPGPWLKRSLWEQGPRICILASGPG